MSKTTTDDDLLLQRFVGSFARLDEMTAWDRTATRFCTRNYQLDSLSSSNASFFLTAGQEWI
jgi:hypothetical protein